MIIIYIGNSTKFTEDLESHYVSLARFQVTIQIRKNKIYSYILAIENKKVKY